MSGFTGPKREDPRAQKLLYYRNKTRQAKQSADRNRFHSITQKEKEKSKEKQSTSE